MSRPVVNITGEDKQHVKDSTNNVVPRGKYVGTVYGIDLRTFRDEEKYVKERGTAEYYSVHLRIAGPTQANRRVFTMIPFFTTWVPKEKGNKGFPTLLIPFFEALGYDLDGDFEIPEPNDLLGKPIGFEVTVGKDQNGDPQNNIRTFWEIDEEDLDEAVEADQDDFDL